MPSIKLVKQFFVEITLTTTMQAITMGRLAELIVHFTQEIFLFRFFIFKVIYFFLSFISISRNNHFIILPFMFKPKLSIYLWLFCMESAVQSQFIVCQLMSYFPLSYYQKIYAE